VHGELTVRGAGGQALVVVLPVVALGLFAVEPGAAVLEVVEAYATPPMSRDAVAAPATTTTGVRLSFTMSPSYGLDGAARSAGDGGSGVAPSTTADPGGRLPIRVRGL
jgi:hypothetical protein